MLLFILFAPDFLAAGTFCSTTAVISCGRFRFSFRNGRTANFGDLAFRVLACRVLFLSTLPFPPFFSSRLGADLPSACWCDKHGTERMNRTVQDTWTELLYSFRQCKNSVIEGAVVLFDSFVQERANLVKCLMRILRKFTI